MIWVNINLKEIRSHSLEVFAGYFDAGLHCHIGDGLGALIRTPHEQPHPGVRDYLGKVGAHYWGSVWAEGKY